MSAHDGWSYLEHTAGVKLLDDVRVLELRGDDRVAWLQGQITADVLAVPAGGSTYALILDTQGKVRADAVVVRAEDALRLLLPASAFDAIAAGLERRIVMEDVELRGRDDLAVVTVQGPTAAEVVRARSDAVPSDRLGRGGFDVLAPNAERDAVLASLADAARGVSGDLIDERAWTIARVRALVPAFGVDFGEWTLPQEAELATRAVSFTKGCYVGQEPVVMLEHRGKPPKRLCLLRSPGAPPTPGDLVDEAGLPLGRAGTWIVDPERPDTALGLGVVKRTRAVAGTELRIDGAVAVIERVAGPAHKSNVT